MVNNLESFIVYMLWFNFKGLEIPGGGGGEGFSKAKNFKEMYEA